MAGPVILSPHPDDAVLSLWHLLTAPESASVLTVFNGPPDGDPAPGWWDRLTRAEDACERAAVRAAEDREALALAGVEPVKLGFVDGQYRDGEQDIDPLTEAIEASRRPTPSCSSRRRSIATATTSRSEPPPSSSTRAAAASPSTPTSRTPTSTAGRRGSPAGETARARSPPSSSTLRRSGPSRSRDRVSTWRTSSRRFTASTTPRTPPSATPYAATGPRYRPSRQSSRCSPVPRPCATKSPGP